VELSAREIAAAADGQIAAGSPDTLASSFTIDSRQLQRGGCFFALCSVRDGHDFVTDAFGQGAAVAVVERAVQPPIPGATLVLVDDAMDGLSSIARLARRRLADATVVGITGSAGKTGTKDLTAAAIGRVRRVHSSPGSYNNEAGVPLTLLGAPMDAEVVVAEMGARSVGNIAHLADIAEPRIGVITHVGMAHAGSLGGRPGIARVKGELLEALPADGLAVLNDECDATPLLALRTAARVVRVGRGPGADIRCTKITLDEELRPRFLLESAWGTAPVALEVRGEHQVENAAQATAVALELGVPLDAAVAGLADARAAAHRMELVRTTGGVLVINDAYNSSPTSAAAAVRSLARLPVTGRRVAVLGEMLELGDEADAEHVAIGALAAEVGLDVLVAVGDRAEQLADGARGTRVAVLMVPDPAAASAVVSGEVREGDAVLVKASRAVGLERVAEALAHGDAA
jgi:UDP-N-acetylmuramoyl-tripeptide--D-alanyl-D-alanine ligase